MAIIKNTSFLMLLFTFLGSSCSSQPDNSQIIKNEIFHWTISLPKGFEQVNNEELKRLREKGGDAIEKTSGEKLPDKTNVIFLFRKGQSNTIESTYQLYNKSENGDYFEMLKGMRKLIFNTIKNQMPDSKLDTLSSEEEIDGLKFQKYQIALTYPSNDKMNLIFYTRLFDDKLFTLNITYLDENSGKLMNDAWFNSKFQQ